MDVGPELLRPYLQDDERVVAAVAGALVGPAVGRALDVVARRIIGPEPAAVVVVTAARVFAIRRHPGGRLDRVVWEARRSAVEPTASVRELVVVGTAREHIVFRPHRSESVELLAAALNG